MAFLDPYRLNSGMRCVKYMLLIISAMFAITSILLIMVGSTIQAIFGDFHQFLDAQFSSPPALLIAIGFIMFFASMFGGFGAYKESVMLINLYGVFLFLIFILEVSAAIAAFVLQGQVGEMLLRTMDETFKLYENNDYYKTEVDFMQSGLECCGINNPEYWRDVLVENQNLTLDNPILVPQSCCASPSPNSSTICDDYYQLGCYNRMNFVISQSAMLIATGATTVALVQILGVICAFMLAKTLRRNKSIRDARRWQLHQSLGILVSGEKSAQKSEGYTQLERDQLEKSEEHCERTAEQEPVVYTANSPSVN